MAKETRPNCITSYLSDAEKRILDAVDEKTPESKAEFIRNAVIKEATKILKKG